MRLLLKFQAIFVKLVFAKQLHVKVVEHAMKQRLDTHVTVCQKELGIIVKLRSIHVRAIHATMALALGMGHLLSATVLRALPVGRFTLYKAVTCYEHSNFSEQLSELFPDCRRYMWGRF
jgi:hypothetical protein